MSRDGHKRIAGWVGYPGPTGRNGRWISPAYPGVVVRHCGHPTALRPYYCEQLPERRTFRTLNQCQQAVADWWAQEVQK